MIETITMGGGVGRELAREGAGIGGVVGGWLGEGRAGEGAGCGAAGGRGIC